MKAYLIQGPDKAGVVDVDVPAIGPDEILLKVRVASLNHLDVFARAGLSAPGIRPHAYPLVSGCDAVGEIVEVGPCAGSWAPGELVLVYPSLGCGSCPACHSGETSMCRDYAGWGEQTWGGLAEYAAVPAGNLARVNSPERLRELATIPVAYTTAWRALMSAGELRGGETVLIVGIGGGVATAAMSIARFAGATVLVTSRHDWKIERAIASGALDGVNSMENDVVAWVQKRTGGRGADLVLDSVGGPTWRSSIACLSMGGRLCVCGATGGDSPDFSIRELYQSHRRIIGAPMGGRRDFDAVFELVSQGDLQPAIDSVLPLAEIEDGLDRLERGEQFGKLLIEP